MTPISLTRISSMLTALLMALFLTTLSAGAAEPADDNAVFDAKAKELTAGKASSVEKVLAIQAFVRDSIRQVETQYG